MNLNAIASRIRADIQHFGVGKTAFEVLIRGVNLCVYFKIFKAMKIEVANPDFFDSKEPFQWQFLDESQLFELARNPNNGLVESFVQSALEKGDECYGALDGEALACYGWYSNKPTEMDNGLTLHFNPDYTYMYNGFTHRKYRGKRLHAIGMNRALREYLGRGFKGLISYVESHNFSSLQSVYRMGYQDIGCVVVLKIGSHPFMHTSRGCREHGVFLAKPTAAAEPVLTGLLRRARRGSRFAVLFIDVDRCKIVNDTAGHRAGDQVLQTLARRLLANVRPGDFVARYGGDAFVALIEDVRGEAEVEQIAARIRAVLTAPIHALGGQFQISASVGIAIGHAASSAQAVVDKADLAMYRVKQAKRTKDLANQGS